MHIHSIQFTLSRILSPQHAIIFRHIRLFILMSRVKYLDVNFATNFDQLKRILRFEASCDFEWIVCQMLG